MGSGGLTGRRCNARRHIRSHRRSIPDGRRGGSRPKFCHDSTSVIGVGTDGFTEQVTAAVDSLTMGSSVGSGSRVVGRIVCEEEIEEEMVDYE